MEYNIADLFESVVDVVPDREALVYIDHPGTGAERRLTYAELDAAANRVAHHLIDTGIRPGEHLGLHLYNGIEYLQTVLGCLKARVVPVNVNYRYVEEELAYLYRDADLVALVFDTEFTERVAAALPRAEQLRHLVRVGAAPEDGPDVPAVDFTDAEAAGSPERGFPARSADDQFIIYTGGTTGMPKGVMWRQEDLFFSGLGGGAPTGEPVKKPEELAERVAAAWSGDHVLPHSPADARHLHAHRVHRLQFRPTHRDPPQVRAGGGAADHREGEGHQHVPGRRRDAAPAHRRPQRAHEGHRLLVDVQRVVIGRDHVGDGAPAVPGAAPEHDAAEQLRFVRVRLQRHGDGRFRRREVVPHPRQLPYPGGRSGYVRTGRRR